MLLRSRWKTFMKGTLATLLLVGAGGLVRAQEETEEEGRIIQLSPPTRGNTQLPGGREDHRLVTPGFPDQPPAAPQYWIGIVGGPVTPAVRHHVDIPEGKGLMVMEVVPDSPAAEAGLRPYDVMLRANDVELADMRDLVDLVISEGEKEGQISIELTRQGQVETVWVTPASRPDQLTRQQSPPPAGSPRGWFGQDDFLGGLFGNRPDGGFQFRNFGPGVAVRERMNMNVAQLPDGTSIKIEKRSDEPTRITVERDGDVWEVEGDDPEALEQLPEDLRPHVQRMLGQDGRVGFEFRQDLPDPRLMPRAGDAHEEFRRRLEQMEEQMRELHDSFFGGTDEERKERVEDEVH